MDSMLHPLKEKHYQPLIALDKQINRFVRTRQRLLLGIDKNDIAVLWENLTQAFGAKFTSSFGYSDNGVWYDTLSDLTKAELMLGFKAMLKSRLLCQGDKVECWPPNVKELYAYCQHALDRYGIKSYKQSYYECQHHLRYQTTSWSHAVVYYAGLYTGSALIEQDFWGAHIADFKQWYLLMCILYTEGVLPKIPSQQLQQQLLQTHANRQLPKNVSLIKEIVQC